MKRTSNNQQNKNNSKQKKGMINCQNQQKSYQQQRKFIQDDIKNWKVIKKKESIASRFIKKINPPLLKFIESQGYVFSHLLKCQMSSKLRNNNVYQYMSKVVNEYDIINLYPKDDKVPEVFNSIHKWVFPSGIRPLKPGEEKYTKVNKIIDKKDINESSSIQDFNYFAIRDPSSNKIYRCVSGIFYEKISTKAPKEKKNTVYLVPISYCVISEHLFYHPMKKFINFLIGLNLNSQEYISQLKELNSIFLDQILEDENKLEDFIIQSVFHCSEIKGHNHKLNINLTSDTSHPFLSYYNKNDISQPFLNLICPSNISFEHLIFNQSPNNLFYLAICLLMEYQIVITSSKQSTSTLFCENLLTLIRPVIWKGLYYPTHLNSGFNYQNCTQPFLIGVQKKNEDGLERFQKQPNNRVIYDLDENSFIFKPIQIVKYLKIVIQQKDDIPIPLSYKNYLIKNLNFIIADLRFWEEQQITIEAEMKYKQYFYNFILLIFHDILNYFQKGTPPSMNALTPSNQQPKASEDQKSKEKQNQASKKGKNTSEHIIPSPENQAKTFISLGYAFFNQEEYIKSFGAQDQGFFQKISLTKGFEEFVKNCFRSIDYKMEFIKEMRTIETEYCFHQIFLYINDCRYLAKRQTKDQTLNDKILEIEQMQIKIIQGVLNKQFFPDIQMSLALFSQEYLEGLLQFRSVQDIKTTARSQASSEKQNLGLYGINPKDPVKQHPQIKNLEMLNLQQKQAALMNQGGSFLQLTYRQGMEGEDTQRTYENNPLFMCEISRIDQAQGGSQNLNKIDEKQYEQILNEMYLPRFDKGNNEWDRISTICSHNDLDMKANNANQIKNEPNSLQLFNKKNHLERRFNQECDDLYSPEKKQQIKGMILNNTINNNQNEFRSYLGINNLNKSNINNAFINTHSTINNLDEMTTCSQRGQIINNISQMKFSPSNSISQTVNNNNNNFLSNIDYNIVSSQKISITQNKSLIEQQNNDGRCHLIGNLQKGCFDMWGHYQEEGNFNIL